MAYVSKELKTKVAGLLKAEFGANTKAEIANRGFKYSLSVHNHSTLVLTISEGHIDFIGNHLDTIKKEGYEFDRKDLAPVTYIDVNEYRIDRAYSGHVQNILNKIKDILNTDNYNRSDLMTDYHDVGHYISIRIGKWDKPYRLLG